MTMIYLAVSINQHSVNTLKKLDWSKYSPNLLISYFYLKQVEKLADLSTFKAPSMMLDSGAYSAWNSKKSIDIEALIEETKNSRWNESVALDVIGDAKASLKNALYMKSKGSPAFPVFHIGEPWEVLKEYCNQFSKVGLSCHFGEPEKTSLAWLDNCFARHWPHKFHSFGWIKESVLNQYPFHSGDSSSWAIGPSAYGNWTEMGRLRIKNPKDLTAQVEYYTRIERRLKMKWIKELAQCDQKQNTSENKTTDRPKILI